MLPRVPPGCFLGDGVPLVWALPAALRGAGRVHWEHWERAGRSSRVHGDGGGPAPRSPEPFHTPLLAPGGSGAHSYPSSPS